MALLAIMLYARFESAAPAVDTPFLAFLRGIVIYDNYTYAFSMTWQGAIMLSIVATYYVLSVAASILWNDKRQKEQGKPKRKTTKTPAKQEKPVPPSMPVKPVKKPAKPRAKPVKP
jgi:hypothetical protein